MLKNSTLKWWQMYFMQGKDVKISPSNETICSCEVIICVHSDTVQLKCASVRHGSEDIYCFANRVSQFIKLKQEDVPETNIKCDTLPFFRKCTVNKYLKEPLKEVTFQAHYSRVLREFGLSTKQYDQYM